MNETESKNSILFQKELENILSLLVKENSLDILADEILLRSVNLTHSSFGMIIFTDENAATQIDYKIYDQDNHLKDKAAAVVEVKAALNYILKWLKSNNRSLSIKYNDISNLAYNLFLVFETENLVITPCFIDNNILAVLICTKNNDYSLADISTLEQFATLLAFSVSNILTRKLNDALTAKLQQSQKLETIGKLASGMAHDFNNLLSSIFGSINLMKKKLADRPDINYLLENVENCSVRAADLTKGLLSYGKTTPKRKTLIKPNELLEELLKVINQTFPKEITIKYDADNTLEDILGNATEIYQVLLNLCINAKEAIKGTGQITFSAHNFTIDDKKIFDYPLLNQGNYVLFSIKDTGEGISENNLTKIFDPYFSTKQKETVSGLGLYITYGIVKAHGGLIDVSSRLNEGTEFNVFIPVFKKQAENKISKTEKIILLADDEIMLRDILAELLESYNFEVVSVENGSEALRILTEEIKADLLIIDFKMPEMDGITCIRKIRDSGLKLPIILSTGSIPARLEEEAAELNIDFILNKPYEFDKMLEAVRKLI